MFQNLWDEPKNVPLDIHLNVFMPISMLLWSDLIDALVKLVSGDLYGCDLGISGSCCCLVFSFDWFRLGRFI